MTEVLVVCEGQTEQSFVGDVLAPFLAERGHVRASAASPEHINDGRDAHPSARLRALLHGKVLHGRAVSALIGVERIRAECRHFGDWLQRLESLPPLR